MFSKFRILLYCIYFIVFYYIPFIYLFRIFCVFRQSVPSFRLIMSSRRLWNLHRRNKFLRAETSRVILSLGNGIFSGFKRCFPPRTPCCLVRKYARLGTMPSKCTRHSKTSHGSNFSEISICLNMHSMSFKTRKGVLYIFIQWCFLLLAVMVEGDESSRVRMANYPIVLVGYWPLLTALNRLSTICVVSCKVWGRHSTPISNAQYTRQRVA